jgi:hypothetical protein
MKRNRRLKVNWSAINGAAHAKRKLILRQNEHKMYTCPVQFCLYSDFKSSRGLRKHIDSKHAWFYFFDKQPEIKREEIEVEQHEQNELKKACTSNRPSFSIDSGVGYDFMKWLCTSCGGGKTEKEAKQTATRAMKYLMESLGNNENDNELTVEYIDCCLSSPSILIKFLQTLEEQWKLSSSGSLNYVKAIGDMVDFRKANGVSDNTLRCFTITEVYLRRAKENLRKKKNFECYRNLDLESLIAKESWASIEEMEEVIPFHMSKFQVVIRKCISNDVINKHDLVYCIRFITALLFLRVKCSRPMTYQFLTVTMVSKAKENDGFIDQTEFKTASKYIFDTLIITPDVMHILDLYIEHVRPRLTPKSDYLLLSTKGTQFQSLTTAMAMMVHQAIGKYINPTRYRQIIETESNEVLTQEEQTYISEDQKHSSTVAKIFYQKKRSRKVAIEGKKCMDKITKQFRSGSKRDVREMFERSDNTLVEKIASITVDEGEFSGGNSSKSQVDPYQPVNLDDSTDMIITNTVPVPSIPNNDIAIKKEVACSLVRKSTKNTKFSEEEDRFLKVGIKKHGKSWASILKDKTYNFHPLRTRDSLRMRADGAAFKKYLTKE